MRRKRDENRNVLATTFTDAEVNALDQLMRALREGRDATVIARSPGVTSAYAKFIRLKDKSRGSAS